MQTRKRAKSISFGKPEKTEETVAVEKEEIKAVEKEEVAEKEVKEVSEKEEVKATALEEKVEKPEAPEEPHEPTEAAKKVILLEEEEQSPKSELSDTPTVAEPVSSELHDTPEKPETVTPVDEFITDTQPDKEPTIDEPKAETNVDLNSSPDATLSPLTEPEVKPATSESETQDLSPTPPASAFSLQDGESGTGEKRKHFLVYFLVIALFSFILGIGAMAAITSGLLPVTLPKEIPFNNELKTAMKTTEPTVVPTKVAKPTIAPTAAPVDLKAYTISILNGSGIRGKAAEVKTSLTAAGFTIGTTGNAANNDFTATQISAKKDVDEAYLEKLKAELAKEFKVAVSAAPAPASQTADVVVTIGSDTAN
ncbi:MAG: LytR C-terminal domain-containing protein [Candidatus Levybacteria bacterium]|nr:LytR C-terminal domain-containing protein [Candidatus Levybacteria bacterium]